MGKSLEEYAALHQQQNDPFPQQAAPLRTAQDRAQDREQVEHLKLSIAQQLESGSPAQYPLYSALRIIGIVTGDTEWMETQMQTMAGLYDGVEQQSLLMDEAALAARRLEDQRVKYNERIQKQIRGQLASYDRLHKALEQAYLAATALDAEDP